LEQRIGVRKQVNFLAELLESRFQGREDFYIRENMFIDCAAEAESAQGVDEASDGR
jgi:hypothetical protein